MTGPRVLVNGASVRSGGSETFLSNLLPRLTRCLDDWHFDVVLRESRLRLYASLPANAHIVAIPDASIGRVTARLRFEHFEIPARHRRGGYALHFQADEMLSPMVPLGGVPSLAVYHTTPMVMFDDATGESPWLLRYARFIRRNAARHCTVPVTVSNYARGELSGLYVFARDRFRVVYHGVDQQHFRPGDLRDDPRRRWRGTRPYILSISNRFQWKNYYRLIVAFHRFLEAGQNDHDLVLVGKAQLPAEEQRISEYLVEHELTGRVHLVDAVPQAELPDVYRAAAAYVFPSLRETFGMTVLEAMACGLPVACARWGPLPEVAGDAAGYFDPLDVDDTARALVEITRDEALRQRLAQRGLERAGYFTWQRAAQAYERLCREAVER